MNINFKDHIPEGFNDDSRIWIYQSNRLFAIDEASQIEATLKQFAKNWKSHGIEVKGYANLFFGQFIIVMADETATGVSGCSTDSSVRVIKEIEQKFDVQLFERQTLAFIIRGNIYLLPMAQLEQAIEDNLVQTHTLYFNNTVLTKEELLNKWIIPVNESWLSKRYKFPVAVN